MSNRTFFARAALAAFATGGATLALTAAGATAGRVVDLNDHGLAGAMVTLTKAAGAPGPAATTVFTDGQGAFVLPDSAPGGTLSARLLGYAEVAGARSPAPGLQTPLMLIMRAEANQAGVAPASAWLAHMTPQQDREQLVMACVACHQMPAPEVRAYAKVIDDTPQARSAAAHEQSWAAIVQQMNLISAREFSRNSSAPSTNVYSGGDPGPTAHLLAEALVGPMQELKGYEYGAPLAVTAKTVIREYAVPEPNAIREAITLYDPGSLWVADVSTNRIMRVDTASGAVHNIELPGARLVGPHTLVRGRDGLWIGPFFPGVISHLDPKTESWKMWPLAPVAGHPIGVHDLSFDTNHELITDRHGRIWFSDIANNAVGWIDTHSGRTGSYAVPPVAGRIGNEQIYGLAMSPDRTHIWYAQLGIGCFGSFDVDKLRFDAEVTLADRDAGPRRISMAEDGILYLALYGSGQLAAYDTHAGRMLGIYDMPDRASAPYSTTWDPRRKVVWITTSNADALYRFDPKTQGFGVIPLPRERAFLRSVNIDPYSGALVTSYANIVQHVRGPRMAVIVDLGDELPKVAALAARQP